METGPAVDRVDKKLESLRLEYEQYFLGQRPNEPLAQRRELERLVAKLGDLSIPNTALRFRLQSTSARFQALRRQWNETLRKIEAGTYKRHVFRANLRGSAVPHQATGAAAPPRETARTDVFDAYVKAARACGVDSGGLTRKRLETVLRRREEELRQKLGCERVEFGVAVKNGRVTLRARPAR